MEYSKTRFYGDRFSAENCNIRFKYFIKREWFYVTTSRNYKVSWPHYQPISFFTYCCIVWYSIGETLVDSLQKLQSRAARVITGASYSKQSADIRHELGLLSLSEMRQHHMALMMFKVNHGLCPSYLSDLFDVNTSLLGYDLRSSGMNLIVPKQEQTILGIVLLLQVLSSEILLIPV